MNPLVKELKGYATITNQQAWINSKLRVCVPADDHVTVGNGEKKLNQEFRDSKEPCFNRKLKFALKVMCL